MQWLFFFISLNIVIPISVLRMKKENLTERIKTNFKAVLINKG